MSAVRICACHCWLRREHLPSWAVAKVPERLSLTTLAALCDIFHCDPAELIEVSPARQSDGPLPSSRSRAAPRDIRPRPAKVARDTSS